MENTSLPLEGTSAIQYLEQLFDKFGLMTGSGAQIKRALLSAVFGGVLVSWMKPSLMFTSSGVPKSWSITSSEEPGNTTPLPWWMVPVLFAFVGGLFI
jgi:hypothetical protein